MIRTKCDSLICFLSIEKRQNARPEARDAHKPNSRQCVVVVAPETAGYVQCDGIVMAFMSMRQRPKIGCTEKSMAESLISRA